MRGLFTLWIGCLAALIPVAGIAWAETCRQALALGLDVSSSVNSREYRLQLDGLATALTDPEVARAVLGVRGAWVRLLAYEWSGPGHQRILIGWTEIRDRDALEAFAGSLRETRRVPANPATALGAALLAGGALLAHQPGCRIRTLDISGDGRSNTGPGPDEARRALILDGITVNALVVGSDAPDGGIVADDMKALESYFRQHVIKGSGAFVETARGFEDFQAAMTRKLLRELAGMALSGTQVEGQEG